jgi:hypothetical protein
MGKSNSKFFGEYIKDLNFLRIFFNLIYIFLNTEKQHDLMLLSIQFEQTLELLKLEHSEMLKFSVDVS